MRTRAGSKGTACRREPTRDWLGAVCTYARAHEVDGGSTVGARTVRAGAHVRERQDHEILLGRVSSESASADARNYRAVESLFISRSRVQSRRHLQPCGQSDKCGGPQFRGTILNPSHRTSSPTATLSET